MNLPGQPLVAPIGLLYLVSTLKKNNICVKILDHNVENISVKECLMDFVPDLVGIGCCFSGHITETLDNARQVKAYANVPVVIGGIHPTIYYKDIMKNCPEIDYIILGEGEISLLKLCNYIQKNDINIIQQINGIVYRAHNNDVVVNTKTKYIENVSDLPWPDYKCINIKNYYYDTSNWHNPKRLNINTSLPIISSRSCPMQCNFCSMYILMGKKIRKRNPYDVVNEIEYLYNEYDHRYFSFYDDNVNLDRRHILTICSEIKKRKLNIQFDTPNGVHVNSLDEEVVEALVSSGLVRVSLAIEHGSEYIRNKIMGKNLSTEKIYSVVNMCKKYHDLYIRTFFIMGMPEDTRETLQKTYEMIEIMDIDKPIVTNVVPFPGTKLFDQCIRDNIIVGVNVEDLWRNPDAYFTGNKQFFVKPYNMTMEELIFFRNKFDLLISQKLDRSRNL